MICSANITAKQIIITPDDGQSKTVGDPDPVFKYSSPALIGSDAISGALGRETGDAVGSYPYTLGTLSAGPNYSLVMVASPSTFAISIATGIKDNNDISGLKLKNYPNPFFGYTIISYTLPNDGHVSLTIHKITGQLIKTIVNEMESKGDYSLNVDDWDLQPGMYLAVLRLKSNGKEQLMTIRLVKGR